MRLDYGDVWCAQGNLSARRRALILMAFDRLDKDGSGVVTIEDVRSAYDTSKHPDVLSGKKTPDEALREFMAQWDTDVHDGRITKDEFLDYYKGTMCLFPLSLPVFSREHPWPCALIRRVGVH